MKKINLGVLALTAILTTTSAFAIQINNETKYTVKYIIGASNFCRVMSYMQGEISAHSSTTWTQSEWNNPDIVCVAISSRFSAVDPKISSLKNEGCIVKVVDPGFPRDFKLEKVSGCDN